MRDSNENHIFINEKLNQALKKANQRIEDLESKLSQHETSTGTGTTTNSNDSSKKSTKDGSTLESEKIKKENNGKDEVSES